MRKPFQIFNFKQHVDDSGTHKSSLGNKKERDWEKRKGETLKCQPLPPFAKRPKTHKEAMDRVIKSGVNPDLVLKDNGSWRKQKQKIPHNL
eukprot:12642824-Ditylum_brightwellii.AAC.1